MANNTQTFTGRVLLDDKQAKQAVEQLSRSLEQLRKKRKDAIAKGKDVKEFDRQIRQTSASINALKTNQQQVNDTLKNLSSASYKELNVVMRSLQKQLRSGAVERNTEEWKMLQQKLKEVKREMAAINNESKEAVGLWGRTVNFLNTNWGAVTQLITGYDTLRSMIQKCAQAYADMEESMADVRKYNGQTNEQVHQMNEDFKRMDTRTAREQLNELAGSAGRLGITNKEMIEEFVDGADKINVALGDDLGKGAVDKIGKLAQMFGEDKTKGLRGAMLATGSAVNELAQNSSANAGYIVDFTADLSGVGIQAGMTQAQLMGLASALDQNMQEEATSATVFSQLITKMYQEPAKFAKIAGMEVEKFSTLMKTDANEGLMKFMQAMKSRGGFAEMAPMFEEMQLNGTRAVGVLSAVASHLDQVKTAQDLATQSYEAGTSVIDEFNVQNNTVQAQLDKAKKSFQDLTIELGEKLRPMAILCISTASISVKMLSVITEFVYKFRTTLITLTATIIALTVAENLHAMKLKLIAFWNDVVIAGSKKLWATLLAHPYVAVAGAAAMLIAVIVDLTRKTDTATKAQKNLNDIRKQAAKDIVEEKEKLENLRRVAKDEHQSLKDRYTAIAELNKIVPNYNASIDKTTGKYKENKKAMVMELAQAVAQTATGAISAYSSTMAGAPYPANLVLAPISAGIALAAGMLQVATIKKQHQAEAAGYYEGDFTGPGSWKKEAGVVHAGEFVANHNAVNNPQLLPALKLIDMAQRNNTVASLTAQDVSRAVGGGGAAVVAPVVKVSTDNEQVTAALDGVSATIDLLNQQLNDGIQAEVVITGRNGFAKKWKEYNKMLDNK